MSKFSWMPIKKNLVMHGFALGILMVYALAPHIGFCLCSGCSCMKNIGTLISCTSSKNDCCCSQTGCCSKSQSQPRKTGCCQTDTGRESERGCECDESVFPPGLQVQTVKVDLSFSNFTETISLLTAISGMDLPCFVSGTLSKNTFFDSSGLPVRLHLLFEILRN